MAIMTDIGNGQLKEIAQKDLFTFISDNPASGSIFFEKEVLRVKESVFRLVKIDPEKSQLILELQNVDPIFALVSSFVDEEITRLASFNQLPPEATQTDKAIAGLYDQIRHICRQIKEHKAGKRVDDGTGTEPTKPVLGPGGLRVIRESQNE